MKIDSRRSLALNTKPAGSGPVVYVVARDQRVDDNWALLTALARAHERGVPCLVLFPLGPMFCHGSARHNEWMVASLKELETELAAHQIPFFLRMGVWTEVIPDFVREHGIGEVIFDFNPLEPVRSWREEVAAKLPIAVSVVDAHNVIPCWLASPKAEFAAYTFRPKVHRLLGEFLTEFPKVKAPAVAYTGTIPTIDWEEVRAYRACDYSEIVPSSLAPGARAGKRQLRAFIDHGLSTYETDRNDPTKDGTSQLSAYIRWGNIAVARIALEVKGAEVSSSAKESFLEELIVRREVAENYCYYTKDYDRVEAAHAWAQTTLKEHMSDVRTHVYTYEEFRDAKTHDVLWNAAQRQMVQEGRMHGFLRMYWAKKILEWTPDPQTAIDIALTLNDRYELDGRDSNGVTGVMWSIAGVHDRAWTERPIFGKIRYMNYAGCKRKFDVKRFEARYADANVTESALF